MSASPPKSPPKGASQRVVEYLHEGIKSGILAPGQRLVEADLARDLGVSRGTIREALNRLAAEGLAEITPHRGAAVRQMTLEDVAELFAMREIIEGGAARLAAERVSESPLRDSLLAEIEEQRRWTEATDIPGYVEANERMHGLLVEIADNQFLTSLIGQLQTNAWRTLSRDLLSVSRVRESSRQHVAILEAVAEGRADSAEKLMREHIRTTRQENARK